MIPKIFHHIYWDFSNQEKEIPEEWSQNIQRFKDHHPDWKFHLWNLQDCERILTLNFPNYLDLWNSFSNIQKCDFSRYMILFVYGGVYTDLDCVCHKNIQDLIDGQELVFPKQGWIVNNYFLCSSKGNKFWLRLMKRIPRIECPKIVPNILRVTYTTGPMALTMECYSRNYNVLIIDQSEYVEHVSNVSWIDGPSKSKVFNFCGFIIMLFLIAFILGFLMIISLIKN